MKIPLKHITTDVTNDQELINGLALKYDASNPNGYETPSQLNTRDINNRNRSNHTGSQLSSTISDFAATVRSVLLNGLSTATNSVITATDNVLVAFGKLQAQVNDIAKKRRVITFQYIDNMNFSQYLVAENMITTSTLKRSGDASNGYANAASAPHLANFNGSVVRLTYAFKGVGGNGATPGTLANLKTELWKVGWSNEGTKIADIVIPISSSNIGTWGNSSVDTNTTGSIVLSGVNFSEGDLLGLKFINSTNTGEVNSVRGSTILLELKEN